MHPAVSFRIMGQFKLFFSSETILRSNAIRQHTHPCAAQGRAETLLTTASLIFGGLGSPVALGKNCQREVLTIPFPKKILPTSWKLSQDLYFQETREIQILRSRKCLRFSRPLVLGGKNRIKLIKVNRTHGVMLQGRGEL